LSRSEPNFNPDKAKIKMQLLKDASNMESAEVEDLTACSHSEVGEQLHLCLEEAFFLSFGLGCLQVDHNGTLLNVDQMWTLYCNSKKDFPPRYAAYHHFRSSGWIVRSGLKFGTDFCKLFGHDC
jgi:tRNA splicing endonuclease